MHCWHLDKVAQHLEGLARQAPIVREVFAHGLAWVRFRVGWGPTLQAVKRGQESDQVLPMSHSDPG
jgi:hypothetical protein